MKTKIIIASSLLALVSTAAFAQTMPSNLYGNVGVTANDNDGVKTTSLSGKFGIEVNKNLAFEAEGGVGIDTDKIGAAEYKHKGDLGAYAVGQLPVNEKFSLLGRVGYHHVWDQVETSGVKVKGDDGSFAAGVGGQFMFDDKNGVRADYTRYTENDGMDNFAVSYVRKF